MKRIAPEDRARANQIRLQAMAHEQRRKLRRRMRRENRERLIAERRSYAVQQDIIFDSQIARHQLILPAQFSLSANYEPTASILEAIREVALRRGQRILLHFEHVTDIEPAAALALVSEIYRVRNLRTASFITGTYPRDWDVYLALSNMGFFKFLSIVDRADAPRAAPDPSKPIYLKFMTDNRADWGLADQFVTIVENNLMQFNDLARQRLVKAIGEAITNTLDHAHPPDADGDPMRNRWWLSAWLHLEKKEVAIIVLDKGVGIPSTLPPSDYERISAFLNNLLQLRLSSSPSDGELILAATEYHRSGTGSGERGRGFSDMKQFIDICSDGELRVLSNRGSYHYMRGQEQFENNQVSIGGTVIEWRFRHLGGLVEFEDE